MKTQEELKEYIFDLSWMEGAIGGSTLDDLRDVMGIDSLNDGDIVFKFVPEPSINLNDYLGPEFECPPGHTFVAYCTKHECKEYLFCIGEDYPEWKPI